jgi:copper(I)-binding protein
MLRALLCCLPLALAAAEISVEQAWSRATAPGQTTGAVFATIRNAGAAADRLESATCAAAGTVELHGHELGADGLMRMRAVPAIEIPAGAAVELKPGGLHIMLFDLRQPLAKGATTAVTLRFQRAGEITIAAAIEAAGAMGPAPAAERR